MEVVSWVLSYQADHWTASGDLTEALAIGQEAVELSHALQSPLSIAVSGTYLAKALFRSGRLADALELLGPVLEHARTTARTVEPETCALMALVQLELGNPEAARSFAAESLALAKAAHFDRNRLIALIASARVERQCRAIPESHAFLDAAEALALESGLTSYVPEILEVRGRLASAEGDEKRATALRARAGALYREIGAPLQAERLEAEALD
jgi:tetratricopeptide (TPR) repeat protein